MSTSGVRDRTLPSWFFHNRLRRWFKRPGRLIDFCPPKPGDVVADLGAGGGFFLAELSRRVGSAGRIYAADIDDGALSVARRVATTLEVTDRAEFIHSSAASVPSIPSAGVDYILSNRLLCCLIDKERAMEEMRRILKQGGCAVVTFVTIGPRWTARGRALRTSERRFRELLSVAFRTISG